jgi:hypothetical protein
VRGAACCAHMLPPVCRVTRASTQCVSRDRRRAAVSALNLRAADSVPLGAQGRGDAALHVLAATHGVVVLGGTVHTLTHSQEADVDHLLDALVPLFAKHGLVSSATRGVTHVDRSATAVEQHL